MAKDGKNGERGENGDNLAFRHRCENGEVRHFSKFFKSSMAKMAMTPPKNIHPDDARYDL